ncbi:4-hydroxy-tetrahydrodipicolinate synthase [Pacificimonas pallii]|nr:4-hydroxy-tetrahydrodipicolinate synthase [Pacificimonas pallii]
MPALVTPMSGGKVDWDTQERLVDWQIREGSRGLVPCGTTGESPTLTIDEHHEIVARTVRVAAGRVPVIAGAGSNDTATSCLHVKEAAKAGADAALVIVPYYNRPDQDGMYAHFKAVSECSDLPIVLYNVPGRTIADLKPDTVRRLAELPGVIGIKDASADVARCVQAQIDCPKDFTVLSGNDELALGMMVSGARGLISVTANVAPRACADFMTACDEDRWSDARAMGETLHLLHLAMFAAPSPAPVKYAMAKLGIIPDPEVRLPMLACTDAQKQVVDAAMTRAGLD